MIAVALEGASKRFRLRTADPTTTLKTAMVDFLRGRRPRPRETAFHALRDITLTIGHGKTLGIIGRNGSGKSTLLKLIARIYRPDAGGVRVYGRVAGLLELGAGFHPEFSGRENIFINGIVLGLSKRELRRRFEDIVRFAELDAFIDEPVRTYSSGMYMRLGFSVAVHTDPDVFLIDEILGVGDEAFQQKCAEKIGEFQRRGKTLALVTHDLQAAARWCDEVVWLEQGTVREQGDPQKVIALYRDAVTAAQPQAPPGLEADAAPGDAPRRWGTREVEIVDVRLLDGVASTCARYRAGDPMTVEIRYRMRQPVRDVVFGIAILRDDGLWCFGTNTQIEGVEPPPLSGEGMVRIALDAVPLADGRYYLDVAAHTVSGRPYDYQSRLHPFTISSGIRSAGVLRLPQRWLFRPGAASPTPGEPR